MVVNFVLAIGLVHLGDSYPNAFPAIIVLTGSGYPASLAWESQASGQHAQDGPDLSGKSRKKDHFSGSR